jgi:ATP-binding cassette subfamily B (MDR/TAP) protein 1
MEKPKGKYKRLVESQGRNASIALHGLDTKKNKKKKKKGKKNEDEEDDDINLKKIEEEELSSFNLSRARKMAAPDAFYLLVGSLGALFAGSIFPMWGLLFGEMIELLFRPVFDCDDEFLEEYGFPSCEEYVDSQAQWMKERSYEVAAFWLIIVCACIVGNMMTFWGFGQASERMSKRVRDAAFTSLVRQEVAFFDKRSVGKITSELQDDAARIQTFTGEPVRSFLIAVASLFTGIVLSFVVSK